MAHPGESLRRRPKADTIRERTVLPQRSAAQHDYVGIDFHEMVVVEIEFRHLADSEIFGDEIAPPDKLARDFLRLRLRKIQRDTAARKIDRVENSAAVGAIDPSVPVRNRTRSGAPDVSILITSAPSAPSHAVACGTA